ncbi:polysaccharide deacetylase family protein [Candidatus Saccharibacteria bacterium]|nr:polysaccharide deacetylase family protein [Candidatus Saccharibacteria bacterium]
MRTSINKRFPWLKFAIPIVFGAFLGLVVAGVMHGVRGETRNIPKAPMRIHSEVPNRVFRGDLTGKKLVALTFDDGPADGVTTRLLDVLKEKGAVATFFELGMRMRAYPHITQRAIKEGHEVGSHTMYHQNLITLPEDAIRGDITEAKDVFREVLGEGPELTRVPYGNSNDAVKNVAGTPLVYWSVDTKDWESKNAGAVVENTLSNTRDGSIVLMHDIYDSTVDAVPEIIDRLRADNFEFVTVSELAEIRGVELVSGETYSKFEP